MTLKCWLYKPRANGAQIFILILIFLSRVHKDRPMKRILPH